MDNFKAVYRILTALEASMDLPKNNLEMFNADALHVSEARWSRYIEMMADAGYVKGVKVDHYIDGTMSVNADNIEITLEGLEYLQENSIMQKIYRAAKGAVDLVP